MISSNRVSGINVRALGWGALFLAGGLSLSLAATTSPATPPVTGREGEVVELDKLVVTDQRDVSLAPPSAVEASAELAQIAGGTSLVQADAFTTGRVASVADALKYQPGVLAQSSNGGEGVRLSIRGSGILRGATNWGTGLQVLLDGFPLLGAGGSPFESTEPLAVNYVEVLRGANGFDYAPLSLGGVINYVTKTGYDASPFQARFEAGSFGYNRAQVSSGQVLGPLDYYVSLSSYRQDGYRDDSEADSARVIFNTGYQINENLSTRLFYRYAESSLGNPGSLTWAQIKDDPTASQFAGAAKRTRDHPHSTTVNSLTTLQIDPDSAVEFGLQYRNYPINNLGGPAQSRWDFKDASGSLKYTRDDNVFGDKQSKTTASLLFATTLHTDSENLNAAGVTVDAKDYEATDLVLLASNDLGLTQKLWLTTGLAAIAQNRESKIIFPLPNADTQSNDYFNLAPRAGLRYDLDKRTQLFANVSRSVEAPIVNYFARGTGPTVSNLDLKEQTATTVEIGGRGEHGIFEWNVALYRAWVRDELLTVLLNPLDPTSQATSNASPTIHQGIEAGLNTTLWESALLDSANPKSRTDRIVFRQAYTFNDFRYEDDDVFGKNDLAGVPRHLYQAEIAYEHASGFYVSFDAESSLTRYAADFANDIYAKSYVIFGAKIGYVQPEKGWEVFFEVRNISDERYASVVSPVFTGTAASPVYTPGLGRNYSAGLAYRF
ncbi:MAG: TonB-dependent receptor [Rariglobus sp.]